MTIVSQFASWSAYILERQSLPYELREYLNFKSHEVLSTYHAIFWGDLWTTLLLSMISYIGLFFFWSPARVFYLILIALSLLTRPIYGPLVEPTFMALFDDVYKILVGLNLCLMFAPPIQTLFGKRE
jgi:hypothetical protein